MFVDIGPDKGMLLDELLYYLLCFQCLTQNAQTKAWSDEHCSVTSVDTNAGSETLHCKCSKLLPVVGATTVKASPSAASTTNAASSTTTTASTTEEPGEIMI